LPSGEKLGSKSPAYSRGTAVAQRFWPVSTEMRLMPLFPPGALSANASNLPSGDQDRLFRNSPSSSASI
jgi:hypothetical protein